MSLYADEMERFLVRGGSIAWGIVPTAGVNNETPRLLVDRLEGYIESLVDKGVNKQRLVESSWVTPTCAPGALSKEIVSGGLYYGLANTSAELDAALRAMEKVIDRILELAQKEKQTYLMAMELQRTRRRVNVLERVVMPDLQDTIGHIQGKLEEVERDNINRLMRVAKKIR